MNRELRRLSEREEKRQRTQRASRGPQRPRRERVGFRQFIREVRQELRRVAWPSRHELWTFTVVTVTTTAVLTGIIFGMDFLFKEGVLFMIGR